MLSWRGRLPGPGHPAPRLSGRKAPRGPHPAARAGAVLLPLAMGVPLSEPVPSRGSLDWNRLTEVFDLALLTATCPLWRGPLDYPSA